MEAIAIIPARGGSKGIPGKNLKELGGLSLLARTILAATKSHCITRVYVTSDDDEILTHAETYGAIGIKRPDPISVVSSSSEAALRHALETLGEKETLPQHFFFLQCTSPFLQSGDLDGAMAHFHSKSADSLFLAAAFTTLCGGKTGKLTKGSITNNQNVCGGKTEILKFWKTAPSTHVNRWFSEASTSVFRNRDNL